MGVLEVLLVDFVEDAAALVLPNDLSGGVAQLLHRLDGEVLLIIVRLVRLALLDLGGRPTEDLLDLVVLQHLVLLTLERSELAPTNRVVPVVEFVAQNPVVLRLV